MSKASPKFEPDASLTSRKPRSFRFEYVHIEHGCRPLPWSEPALWVPAIDLFGNEERVVLEVHLPGIRPEDTQVEYGINWVRVSGSRGSIDLEGNKRFYHIEVSRGEFQRLITLPEGLDVAHGDACFDAGVLTIVFPWLPIGWVVGSHSSHFPEEWA
ncbi:Hsp20/alpha crystallin family protein [bacterium]|nr:Hsp20/alpha crystallin family protein [bacterium]